MNYRENLFIFSVYRLNVNPEANELNHGFVKRALEMMNVGFKEVLGMYNGTEEKGFVVLGLKNEHLVQTYSLLFEQESYLMVHNDQTADLKFLSGTDVKEVKRLGKFIPKPDSVDVKDLNAWTKDLSSGGYFIVEG